MGLTRQQKRDAIKHILEQVFDQDPDSHLHNALEINGITSPFDLISMNEVEYELLEYEENGSRVPILKGNAGLLKSFKRFVHYRDSIGQAIEDQDWTSLSCDEFDKFRVSTILNRPIPAPVPTSTPIAPPSSLVRDFKRGIKRDIAHFIALKDDAAWDNWERATIAQARAQDVADVLNANYTPTTAEEIALFDEKQKYMYAVFEKTLLTDKGKSLVRVHQRKYDAQKVYAELSEYALKSTKASLDATSILTYITTSRLGDGTWKGTTHAFILHWQD